MARTFSSAAGSENQTAGYIGVFGCAALLYLLTCAPGAVWQDSGLIQYRVWHNDIEGNLGLALSHPVYYILAIGGKHVLPGEFGHKVTVVTALISAAAVANLFLLLRLLVRRALPALAGALSLALAHTFWWHATVPEIYNLAAALLFAELILLLQYARTGRTGWLWALGFVNGVAVANHMVASIAFLCYAVVLVTLSLRREVRWRVAAIAGLLWIIGALPYEYLIVKNIFETGDFWGTLGSAAFGVRWRGDVLNASISGGIVKENFMWMGLNYPTPNVLLGLVGVWGIYKVTPKRWFAGVVLALSVLFLVFAFRYTVVDRYVFFIPFYCMVSILIGVGVRAISRGPRGSVAVPAVLVLSFLTVPTYFFAPKIAEKVGVTSGRGREIPYRDDRKYVLQPWKRGYRGPERFAYEVLESVEPNSAVIADSTTAAPLLYVQEVKGKRKDVVILSALVSSRDAGEPTEEKVAELMGSRVVYVVSPVKGYCPDHVLERYEFSKSGLIYRVSHRREGDFREAPRL